MQQLRVGVKAENSCHPGVPAPALPGHTGQQGAASSLSHHSRSQEPSSGVFTSTATSQAVATATSSLRARGERWAGTRCSGRAVAFVPRGSQALLSTEQLPGSGHSSGQ